LDSVIETIDGALGIFNDTYDDIVTQINLEQYVDMLNDFELPSEFDTVIDDLNKVKDDIDAFEQSLPDKPGDADLATITEKVNNLVTQFSDIVVDATTIIEKTGNDLPPMINSVGNALSEFNMEISKPDSSVKNDIYSIAAAFSDSIKQFSNELLDSVKTEMGQCQPIYQIYENIMIIVCSYVTNSLNGLWLSLGWTAGFLLPLIIFTNQVIKLRI